MLVADGETALIESTGGSDASAGKETRDFAPFIDALDIDDLMTGVDELAARLAKAALPQGFIARPAAAASDASPGGPGFDAGPLMKTPPPPAPEGSTFFQNTLPAQEIEALEIELETQAFARGAIAAEKGGASALRGGASGASRPASEKDDAALEDKSDAERAILARISQTASIDEEAEVRISVTSGDDADIVVDAEVDLEVVQSARIAVSVEQAHTGPQARDGATSDESEAAAQPAPAADLAFSPSRPMLDARDAGPEPAAPPIAGLSVAAGDAAGSELPGPAAAPSEPEPFTGEPFAGEPGPAADPAAQAPRPLIDHDGVSEFDASLAQDIDIDTIVHVDVNGFAGEVVIDTRLSEEADVRQDVLPTITLTGDEDGFDINISQLLDIDLISDVDIEIVENGGKLYLTIAVNDRVVGQDVAAVDIADGGDVWLDVDLVQDADIRQSLSIDIDVEQELAALFDVDVDVDAVLDIDVSQAGDARIGLSPGDEIDVDLDADSEVDIVNTLSIRIDFTPQ
jgi:hypothetical protein